MCCAEKLNRKFVTGFFFVNRMERDERMSDPGSLQTNEIYPSRSTWPRSWREFEFVRGRRMLHARVLMAVAEVDI